jgi:TatD DNase family protein
MLDCHCHVDQYPSPETILEECLAEGVITVAVTGLPSHYSIARDHLRGQKTVIPALGYHPLLVGKHPKEIGIFEETVEECSYIGEIGIDGSAAGKDSLRCQLDAFDRVVTSIAGRKRFVTIHSRGAVDDVLRVLAASSMYPTVFHWFSGTRKQLHAILDEGHSISINPAMIETIRWRTDISAVPLNRILTETDGPYSRTRGKVSRPSDVGLVLDWLADHFKLPRDKVEETVGRNFDALLR